MLTKYILRGGKRMLSLRDSGELRLEVPLKNGKVQTFVQTKVPVRKAVEYAEGEIELFKKAVANGEVVPNDVDLMNFRFDFLANVFDDDRVTKEFLLDELDCNEIELVYNIINCRVLGNKPTDQVNGESVQADPK